MEVHAPDHPIHTWRDFFIHIATITIGLLIAIGLEQTVEYFHHRHIVREARENIRHELEQNEQQARQNITYVQDDARRMRANLDTARALHDRSANQEHKYSMSFQFTWSSYNQSAWLSARDSGALTYMPTPEVQLYADAYNQQELVNNQAILIFSRQIDLASPIEAVNGPDKLNPTEFQTFVSEDAIVWGRLNALAEFIQQLDQQYKDILKH